MADPGCQTRRCDPMRLVVLGAETAAERLGAAGDEDADPVVALRRRRETVSAHDGLHAVRELALRIHHRLDRAPERVEPVEEGGAARLVDVPAAGLERIAEALAELLIDQAKVRARGGRLAVPDR